MQPLTSEWVEKAEGDFTTAWRERRARKSPNYAASCFHAQQCAEKYLKAYLQEQRIPFQRTHNLVALLEMILPFDSNAELTRPALISLTTFAVEVRYPGMSADKLDASEALKLCVSVREWARRICPCRFKLQNPALAAFRRSKQRL